MKKFKVIPLLMLVFPLTIYCLTIPISFDDTYCFGEKWITDTIEFGNGTKLTMVSTSTGILDGAEFYTAIVFIVNQFSTIGYKNNSAIKRERFYTSSQTLGNPDTVWNSALNCPDSFLCLDTFRSFFSSTKKDTTTCPGKWCYSNSSDITFGCHYGSVYKNFNSIIYLNNGQRKIKIQIDNFKSEIQPPNTIGPCGAGAAWITLMHLRWAADSMGNGIFKESPVKTINPPSVNSNTFPYRHFIVTAKMQVEFNLPIQGPCFESLQVFSLTGHRMAQWQNPYKHIIWKTQGVPAGVYLANIVFENKNFGSYKFVIKK